MARDTPALLEDRVESGTKATDATTVEPTDGSSLAEVNDNSNRGIHFWLVYVALCLSLLLAALDLASVATAAPTIVSDLNGTDFSWVASAYNLASAACLPFSGKLANIFGRRPTMLGSLVIFAAGSAVAGSATTMNALIVGRAIQGVGGGGIQSLTSIVTADLVPLNERGLFTGITGIIWTLGSVTGPFIAGGLAQRSSWRWLFYMNLPLCAVAFVVVFLFLRLKSPREEFKSKLAKLDWIGNILLIASTTSCILALTWGGIRYPWASVRVICPLVLGIAGLALTLMYEAKWARDPTIPLVILSNRTSIFGYIATFLHGIVAITAGFYLPTWFQAVRLASPITSGVDFLPISVAISPSAIIQGVIVAKLGHYRLLNAAGWALMIIGMGLFSAMRISTPIGVLAVYQIVQGVGMGLLYSTYFPVMAPLPIEQNAAAVALVTFVRAFSMAWGVAISATILQNQLLQKIPAEVLGDLPSTSHAELTYSIIPKIASLPADLQHATQQAFVDSLRLVWIVMVALCGAGMLTVLFIKEFPLNKTTDKSWGLEEKEKSVDSESAPRDDKDEVQVDEVLAEVPTVENLSHEKD